MSKITFAVITKNEEQRIAGCLERAAWADEILVLDSCSADRTVEIARRFTDRVFQNEFVSFPHQRNRALDLATGDWVLFVDADERVTPELAEDVVRVTGGGGLGESIAGYWIPRQNIIWGKWIRHGGWYPDHQLRLLRRDKSRYDENRRVHELVVLEGGEGHLTNTFVHYNYDSIGQFLNKQSYYCEFESRTLFERGVSPRPWAPPLQAMRAIKRRLWDLQGYRDGGHGLLLSILLGYYEFVVYAKLLQMQSG
ncbi:MAG: glycosyltransferase family 2 protein [Chloroflexi bacterium]|nr:glycosyltransferase family 2 protein [Chloroflexota bacterium]